MSLKVIKAGILDTIQDMGRYGHQLLGINPTGAMDKYAMQVTNMLVGNKPGEALIELHFPASVFMFTQPALIALGGADFSASINGEPVPNLHCIIVRKNDLLQFHKPVSGARAYLTVKGGIAIKPWLNSYSTHLKAKAGGFNGRNLHKDDELLINQPFFSSASLDDFKVLSWQADTKYLTAAQPGINGNDEILMLPGNEWERLTNESKENFTMTSFVITQQSDRMGYRLNNIPLHSMINDEVVSSAVSFGTIQLLPDGGLIVLMADHQTTGGYPRVAHVITAHHTKLAQMKAGDKIHFRMTDLATAEQLLIKQQQHLLQLQNACTFRLEQYFNEHHH
ncbi:MAG: biotin-dependent carboxyltransferase family protein [Chitinophagaceae bacterium]|jgi:antagonist of KipI|nr:biotin-dependent carboxyltransferase family protein [Chitinophagaceae bacterium]MBK7677920.1 biotin-dependent carboxyltransferase family protein [Chitinophagaceae bacterium]MBL0069066.1 biotin-dependent carboxyltransferase family protein [Chitinophagaceae bacterium]MBP6416862.1 biotin-dependent carboxyltransferase family protein [Chitinophagaceae bacterium]HQW42872.1 biotin-dependent carboxyltransferase family protein [Chitinophagaceae bacterium]